MDGALDMETVISIHAPTRGATVKHRDSIPEILKFQSTLPREERREDAETPVNSTGDFNPRSHERSDNWRKMHGLPMRNFNPRSHERSDSNIAQKICLFLYNTDNKYIIR